LIAGSSLSLQNIQKNDFTTQRCKLSWNNQFATPMAPGAVNFPVAACFIFAKASKPQNFY
jgi:hypothetical protein